MQQQQALFFSRRGFLVFVAGVKEGALGKEIGGDPAFGDYNRKLMRYWAEKWLPLVIEALRDFSNLWQASGILQEYGAPRGELHEDATEHLASHETDR